MASYSFSPWNLRLLIASFFALFFTADAWAAPNPPTYLGAYAASSTNIVLLWNDNSTDEIGFEIFQNGASLGVTQPNVTAVSLNTAAGVIAPYAVRAVNGSGASVFAPVVTCALHTFDAPSSLNALANKESVILSWADNAFTETGFEIETRVLPSGTFAVLGAINSQNVAITDITGYLPPGASYEVRIRTRTGVSAPYTYTAYSNTATFTTQFNAPTGLTATTPSSEGTVNLSWVDNSAIEGGYAIYCRVSGSGSYTLLDYTAKDATTYSISGLTAGTYDFQVAAAYQSTAIIESARSNTVTASTKDGFTSRTYQPITYNQAFSYQAVVSTGSARTSWNITSLPTGLTFNSSTGIVSGTPTVTGVFVCPMTATFANGWTTNTSLTLRIVRAAGLPVVGAAITGQTLANGGNTSVSLTDKFSDPDSESAVRVVTNIGTMDFILYNTATPQTVTNFLSYVNNPSSSGNYNGAVFHRSVPGFIVQGGGFKVQSAPNNFTAITTTASPVNEPGISNLRGTVAMAKVGTDPNSATDQFFVNLANNSSNLDNQNGGFTAFARVAGNGMTVADAMSMLSTVNSTVNVGGTPTATLTDWPLTSSSASMDTSKVVTITSAAPVAVLSYSVTGNTNPSVVSASVSGTNVQINGLAGGQSNVTVTATDLDGSTVAQTFTVTVNQAPLISSSAPSAAGTVGAAYNFNYTASGFPAPTFTQTGTLPPGLSLSSSGVISGTATTAGTFTGTVTATNSVSTDSQGFNITIAKAAATVTLGNLSQSYDGSPKSVTATTNPVGLAVSITYNGGSTVPVAQGSYTVVATITDSNYSGAPQTGTLMIGGQTASSWKSQHFTAGQISDGLAADNADPDNDGLKNLAEYALGLDPLSRSSALPQPTVDGNGLTLVFTRPKGLPDVTYAAESTDNLGGTWNAVALEVISDDGQVQTVRARDTLASGNTARRFMRLIFGTP